MFRLCIGNPTPQTARNRDETVLGWAVDCTPCIDRGQADARHTCHVAKTVASGSDGLNRQM